MLQEAVVSCAKNFDELVNFMQKSGLTNQQIEGALEAHEEGNEDAVQNLLADAIAQNSNPK